MAHSPITSTIANTCWVFVSGSELPRHLFDIVFGIHALRQRGVPEASIWVYTDHPAYQPHLHPYGITNVRPIRDVTTHLATLGGFEFAVMVVTGHGDTNGISVKGQASINPQELLTAARSLPAVKGGAILLGQCFAGLFNYTNAGTAEPQLSLVGATGFSESLSAVVKLPAPIKKIDGSDGLQEWEANLFLAYFFEWLLMPLDVDGDGRFTLMDGHKHASVRTYQHLRSLKIAVHAEVSKLQQDIVALPPGAPAMQVQALKTMHSDALSKLYLIHQDPWVLHSLYAGDIVFTLGLASVPAPVAAPTSGAAVAP